jgi:predicted esterase YcpF (UPF0227 family)
MHRIISRMVSSRPLIIYIHGFNSSPASEKARQFASFCSRSEDYSVAVPELSHDPRRAIAQLEALIDNAGGNIHILVGSSLGGYYATWLAEKYGCRAALVNPAVSPAKTLGEEFLGPQKNLYTGEEYEFTRDYADYLDSLDVNPLQHAKNYLLLVQTGDEVLDYEDFAAVVPAILEFAGSGTLSAASRDAIATLDEERQAQQQEQPMRKTQ